MLRQPLRVLYLGLRCPSSNDKLRYTHCPIIRLRPLEMTLEDHAALERATHLLFTSQSAVEFLMEKVDLTLEDKLIYSVGKKTSACLDRYGLRVNHTAVNETAEGIVELLSHETLSEESLVYWPHAAGARTVIADYLRERGISFYEAVSYETEAQALPSGIDWQNFDRVQFTSPSTLHAFHDFFGELPPENRCIFIGPITEQAYRTLSCDFNGLRSQ